MHVLVYEHLKSRHVYDQIIQYGCESYVLCEIAWLTFMQKCESVEHTWRVFNKMPSQNVVSWPPMILVHVKCGQGQKALELFWQMQEKGVQPNSVTFVGVLKARVSMLVLVMAGVFMSRSLKVDVTFVGNSLVDMSTKCGSMEDAWRVFNKMPSQNVVTWNAMVLMLGQCTLELFQQCNRRMLDQTLLLSWGCWMHVPV